MPSYFQLLSLPLISEFLLLQELELKQPRTSTYPNIKTGDIDLNLTALGIT